MKLLFAISLMAATIATIAASAARTSPGAVFWIVLSSDRDGQTRGYSMRSDGSRVTPLLPRDSALVPHAVSSDGGMISYDDGAGNGIYVSRANGKGIKRLARKGGGAVFSRDGKRLAFTFNDFRNIAVIGTDGRGRRTVVSGHHDEELDWSPDGKSLVFLRLTGAAVAVVVQPLHGSQRVVVRRAIAAAPKWSPTGDWIAYQFGNNERTRGVYVVQPNGAHPHRVVRGEIWDVAWSPHGGRLAVMLGSGSKIEISIVGIDGRELRRLRPPGLRPGRLSWSPDGRLLALETNAYEQGSQVWVVGADGRGLRHATTGGTSELVGWTGVAPARALAPPLLPSEHVLGSNVVETRTPISDLSADGQRVAFIVTRTAADCDHVVVWKPATRVLERFSAPNGNCEAYFRAGESDVELAGSRAAWAETLGCGNSCSILLESTTLGQHSRVVLSSDVTDYGEYADFELHGDGDVLVFNDESRLVRIGTGHESCGRGTSIAQPASVCTTIRSGEHAAPVDSVSGNLIAIREPDAVAVIDLQGSLVHVFPFARGEVKAVRLDDGRLVVARKSLLEAYDAASGAIQLQRQLPSGYALAEVDGGIGVFRRYGTIKLLRLADGHSLTLKPGGGPRFADLEPPGLYYSYVTAAGNGRVVFVPRAVVVRQLG
jgi:hypothetical protein